MQELVKKQKIDFPMDITLLNENGKMAAEARVTYYLRTGSSSIIKNAQRAM